METITTLQAKVTKTAAFDGADVDISGIDPTKTNWTVHLRIIALVGRARFHFHDSVDNFTASLPGPTFNVVGDVTARTPISYTFNQTMFPMLRFGVTSAEIRVQLAELTGANASVTYESWLESGG